MPFQIIKCSEMKTKQSFPPLCEYINFKNIQVKMFAAASKPGFQQQAPNSVSDQQHSSSSSMNLSEQQQFQNPTEGATTTSQKPSATSFLNIQSLSQNPYFAAGAGLYTLTAAAFIGRFAWMMAQSAFRRRFVVSMETTSRDASYEWLMQWMARNPQFKFQQVSVMTSNVTIQANDETTANTTFAPCPAVVHWFTYKGWPMVVQRKRQTERAAGMEVLETVEMTTFCRSAKIMQEIVDEARAQAAERDSDHTIIFHNSGSRWSRQQEPRARRPLGSVMLEGNLREELLSDIRQFLSSRSYYLGLGVPYRRGYLLHGPPGCGKSSLVTALAGELRLAICVLSLSNRSLDDDSLNNLLNTAPLRSIVLLEDIDRAFTNDSRITMSGLLNALDGVAAQEGRLVFMTTNHVDKLDPALIRPGRCDVKMEIGLMGNQQTKEMFLKFFPNASKQQVEEFVRIVPPKKLSPAQLQSHMFLHRHDADEATSKFDEFLKAQDSFMKHVEEKRKRELAEKRKMEGLIPPPLM